MRQTIFSFALDSATLSINWNKRLDQIRFGRVHLRLPQVCRQIHCETNHMLDSFLYISLSGHACICSWSLAFDRQGHDLDSVIEARPVGCVTAQIDQWVEEHGGELGGEPHRKFPSLQRVVCESPEVFGKKNESIRSLFDLRQTYRLCTSRPNSPGREQHGAPRIMTRTSRRTQFTQPSA